MVFLIPNSRSEEVCTIFAESREAGGFDEAAVCHRAGKRGLNERGQLRCYLKVLGAGGGSRRGKGNCGDEGEEATA